jgi:pimeloyl-ACP methyl ester carboxylesterase
MVPEHIEHRLTTPDGRTLAVAEWGDPSGLGLFALHGTPGGRISCWEDPAIYARHGLRRFTLDRPGYGESTRQPGRSVADIVADITFIADTLGVSSFAVTGGSGGGPHALACAALMPDRVLRCLASVSIAPYGPDGIEGDAWFDGMTQGNVIEFRAAIAGEREMARSSSDFGRRRSSASLRGASISRGTTTRWPMPTWRRRPSTTSGSSTTSPMRWPLGPKAGSTTCLRSCARGDSIHGLCECRSI